MFADGKLRMDHVIGGKFKLGRKIGSGSFGELYLGIPPQCFYFYRIFLSAMLVFPLSLSLNVYLSLCFFCWFYWYLGVNVQTGEEIAVKLVCHLYF